MQIMATQANGFEFLLYDGPEDSKSLGDRLAQFTGFFAEVRADIELPRDHPRREVSIAKTIQLLLNAYIAALERELGKKD